MRKQNRPEKVRNPKAPPFMTKRQADAHCFAYGAALLAIASRECTLTRKGDSLNQQILKEAELLANIFVASLPSEPNS